MWSGRPNCRIPEAPVRRSPLTAQQEAGAAGVAFVGVGGGEDQGAEGWQVEPVRELAADDAALLAGAAAGDDFDATEFFGVGGVQKAF